MSNVKNHKDPVYLSPWEKSLVKEYLNDGIEECNGNIEHWKGQIFIKTEKRQWDRVKDYEHKIYETAQLRLRLQDLIRRFE